jgi:amicoumacin kinase
MTARIEFAAFAESIVVGGMKVKKELREAYNDRILEEALKRYGASEGEVKPRGGFESYVFEYEKQGKPHILKITHSSRRTVEYLEGELEWLHYLGDNGMNVCRSVLSDARRYIEKIPWEDEYFLATAYEKAQGKPLQREDWNDDTFRKWGRYVGRMHALTKSYRVSDPAYKRLEWHEEDQLDLRKYVPADQSLVFERMDAILARISKLPKDNDSYGLIHTDLHHGNFYLHEGRIFAFDFDDACYDWFIRDIANILYNVLWFPVVPIDHKAEFAGRFMGVSWRGTGKKIKSTLNGLH